MSPKLLQYDSLKAVLMYLEANSRIQLSQRAPSLRAVENLIPLRIDSLSFEAETSAVVINDTSYKLSILKDYPSHLKTPKYVQKENAAGGLPYEMDDYGFRTDSWDATPGDLDFRSGPHPDEDPWDPELEEQFERYDFMQYQEDFNLRLVFEGLRFYLDDIVTRESDENIIDEVIRSLEVFDQRLIVEPIADLEKYLDRSRDRCQSYVHLWNQTAVSWTPMLQLTISSESRGTIIQTYRSKEYFHSLKQLTTVLLGGRNCVIFVNKLAIAHTPKFVRLPEGLKIWTKHLAAPFDAFESLRMVLEPSSLPLKTLTICDARTTDIRRQKEHTMLQGVQILNLDNYIWWSQWPDIILNHIPDTPVINVRKDQLRRDYHVWLDLVQGMVENGRSLGARVTVGVYEVEEIEEFKEIVSQRYGILEERFIKIPMNNGWTLGVSHEENPNATKPDTPFSKSIPNWMLVMEVKENN